MTVREKMQAYHLMENLKELNSQEPEWIQEKNLALLCSIDTASGTTEKFARILAAHQMPVKEILPCMLDIFQEMLIDCGTDEAQSNE